MSTDGWVLLGALTEALVIAVIVFFIARLLVNALGRAYVPRQPVITAMGILGVLGVIALLGGIFTTHESAYTVAAAVAGGLTGYLTAQAQLDREAEKMSDDRDITPVESHSTVTEFTEFTEEPETDYLDDVDEWEAENPHVPDDEDPREDTSGFPEDDGTGEADD